MLAGEDTKALELVSRYKSPTEVAKALMEAQAKVRSRQEMPRLSDASTPEQIADYRKAMGIPDLAPDATIDKVMEAYGVMAPDGYAMSEVEKGAIADFAKHANGKHLPAAAVREATDFFLRSQAANVQALNKLDVTKQKEWQSALKDELGRDYDPMIAAADTFLKQHFGDRDGELSELVNARLPGGGRLGDNADFIRLVSDLALKNGFTDRIEANALESGGKSLMEQRAEIEKLMFTDSARYNSPDVQAKLDKINTGLLARGEINENGDLVKKRRSA